jgi:hypothetical protein
VIWTADGGRHLYWEIKSMKPNRAIGWIVALTVLIGYALAAEQPTPSGEDVNVPPATPAQEQPEVLTRGPVHEAFAKPVDVQAQAGLVAPNEPPANIEEIPPAERPQGDRFVWVPGYWSWDGDRNNYIWVSACWRVAPPNMYWVPGYWAPVTGGWVWVVGFWATAGVQEIEYMPAPPTYDDVQPPGPPPSPDYIWVPPCWYWYQGQYVLRPGYWLVAHQGWVWEPSHYVWTPRGYVFVAGHWDYPLERRGVLFAPVYFPRSVYVRVGFHYSPSIVVDVGALTVSLFVYPRYCHYYFGDYYDNAYFSIGIYPWFECERIHTWYDPIYVHDRWQHRRTEPRWEERERHDYDLRRADKNLRPARTYHEMETRLARALESQRKNLQVAQPLSAVVASKETPLKFERINAEARRKIAEKGTEVRKFRDERNRWESAEAGPKTGQPPREIRLPTERKGPVAPPTERKEPLTPPTERKGPVTPPTELKEPRTTPSERNPTFVPPREVRVTKPERVKIPASPIVGKSAESGNTDQSPPPGPADEHKRKSDAKDTRDVKDTRKDQGDRKGN